MWSVSASSRRSSVGGSSSQHSREREPTSGVMPVPAFQRETGSVAPAGSGTLTAGSARRLSSQSR
jgi:hypothetical protein